jgi:hypothetical protein
MLLRSGGFSIEYVVRVLKFSILNIVFLVALVAVAVNMANLVDDNSKDFSSPRLYTIA